MDFPVAPEDVRLHYPDGRVQAVECAYVGFEDGLHVWEVTTLLLSLTDLRVSVGMLPAKTRIRLVAVGR